MIYRRRTPCSIVILCLSASVGTFASIRKYPYTYQSKWSTALNDAENKQNETDEFPMCIVYLHSRLSSSYQYLNKWHGYHSMNNNVTYTVRNNGTETGTDSVPFHLSQSTIIERTDIRLKSTPVGPRFGLKWFLKDVMTSELHKFVDEDQRLTRPGGNYLQHEITYFQGKRRHHRFVLHDRTSATVDFRKRRNVGGNGVRDKRGILGGKQKKAKVLGRLLMNGAPNKNDVNEQDEDVDEEDEDYSRGLNNDKMNWKDYENEDGPSVMELIALSFRHKNKKWRSHEE